MAAGVGDFPPSSRVEEAYRTARGGGRRAHGPACARSREYPGLIRRFLVMVALVAGATPLGAQEPASPPPVEFMPRVAFHLSAEKLGGVENERYRWDTNFGGELDIIDYRVGRSTFVANYQAILGEEIRPLEPNQGNYILEGSRSEEH